MHPLHHQERYTLKSFTHSQSSIQGLRADKRLDALVKRQEMEHSHLISGHNQEMQNLRDALTLAMQKFEALFQSNEEKLKDFKTYTISHIGILKEKSAAQESLITEQKKTITDLHDKLLDLHTLYSSKVDMDKFKKALDTQVKEAAMQNLNALQQMQIELKVLLAYLKDEFTKYKYDAEKKFSDLIDCIEGNFNVTKIDREGVLKEIRTYDKTIFIIEKKLENIYTLIERINKRGESCHKPE
jgi:hypothetical protein